MEPVLVLMGVTGCGKSTVGALLAAHTGRRLIEGDSFHTSGNIAKMRRAEPLGDGDREPWLAALCAAILQAAERCETVVVTCSALRRAYRDTLRGSHGATRFIHLTASPALLRRRLQARTQHFMPAELLESQLAALEPPTPDEDALPVRVEEDESPAQTVARILRALAQPAGAK